MLHTTDSDNLSHTRYDPRIIALRSVYGWGGYGKYCMLLEVLFEQEHFRLKWKGEYARTALGLHLQCDRREAERFVKDCVNEFNLLVSDGEFIWSTLIPFLGTVQEIEESNSKQVAGRATQADEKKATQTPKKENNSPAREDPKLEDTEFLTRVQAAEYLTQRGCKVTYTTLSIWATTNRYNLPFHKVGRRVRYKRL